MTHFKRIISIFLTFITTFSIFVVSPTTSNAAIVNNPFNDLGKDAWYTSAVINAYTHGYMSGTADATFSPNSKLTRAMMATILSRIDCVDLSHYSEPNSFIDVEKDKWYHNQIEWMYESGITTGTSNDKYSPNAAITRQNLVLMLYNYIKYRGKTPKNFVDISNYEDYCEISNYAREAMSWAVGNGIVSGTSDKLLSPRQYASRAQIAQILQKFELNKFCHRWGTTTVETITQRTCSVDGIYIFHCKDCEATNRVILKSWHTYPQKPTCVGSTANGCVMQYKCLNCQNTKDTITPHKWDAGVVTRAATEFVTGIKVYTCELCKNTKSEEIPKIKVTYSDKGGYYIDKSGNSHHYKYYIDVEATAYGYAAGYITSTGLAVSKKYMAVDPKVIPYHTRCFVTGVPLGTYGDIGVLQAEDCGAFKNYRIDIFLGSEYACRQFGRRQMRVYILY